MNIKQLENILDKLIADGDIYEDKAQNILDKVRKENLKSRKKTWEVRKKRYSEDVIREQMTKASHSRKNMKRG